MHLHGHKLRLLLGIVALLYVCATIAMPFAHRADTATAGAISTPDELAAYALPDGTMPILCRGSRDAGHGPGSDTAALCEACLLAHAPGLAGSISAVLENPLRPHVVALATHPVAGSRPPLLVSACPRGPPTIA